MEDLAPGSKTIFSSTKVPFEVLEISTYPMVESKEMLDLVRW